ncbi:MULTISPECIES: Bug family tripartite tricarboxylate transporter substrate binding protein [Ramlibacter]|uniref:Tripartite tricarboxylate transporter substrate binding protein n=1 Tax=Ramlibacter pinisoli TaxID=2682844 RepID=A0A6N8IPG3_9BURK|nr:MULTISPECIES: tripartite tricarboxylate transporter substrate binding protein [Ramlibacter]MBA2963761.1 tripartite tricarboxylate transporter substrate binding protein [Ramlibacter sp. CGMCC 1.13660]MVQ28728.1 tripartite tricarboxylate transporter substrate binding protein [Ramlibacter pinisoli]
MTDVSRRHAVQATLAGLASLALPLQAQTTWPGKPIRLVVAYPAGGVSDTVARALADRLGPALGQPVVVENKAGASGSIGLDAVAKSAPDGHVIGFSAVSPLTLNPHLGKSPFDPQRDLRPVVSVMDSPVLLLATSATQARDLRELLAASKARPGSVRWATSGPASLGHVMLEQLKAAARVDITHVPYKGGGQQITDALSGQFEVLSVNAGPAITQHVKAGKLRLLAVGAPARLESFPDAPTLAELGYPAANLDSRFGLFAPAAVPAAVVERLNAEVNKALAAPDLRARLVASDNVPTGGSAAEFARQIAQESESNARIIQAAGIKAE